MRLVVLAAAVAKAQYFTGPDGKQYYTGPGSPWDTSRYNTRPHEKFRADRSTDYPPAEACDADALWRERCKPVPVNCTEDHDGSNGHGIGNSLMMSYHKAAVAAFARGCAPVFREGSGGGGGAPLDPTAYGPSDFRLQDWVQVPDEAPTVLDVHGCVQGVLTRPNARLRAVVEAARGGRAADAPLVALHVRTGWVDSNHAAREGRSWDALRCGGGAAAGDGPRDWTALGEGAGRLVVAADGATLAAVAARVAADADRAYGARAWDLYVASDAPGAKTWVRAAIGGRARRVLALDGAIGHNHLTGGDGSDADVNSLADLVLLGDADVLVHFSSKFPTSAYNRNFCPGLRLEVAGYPRHDLAEVSEKLAAGDAEVEDAWRCAQLGAATVQECACMYQAAYA